MSSREMEVAKSLDPNDKTMKSYTGRFEGKSGTLVFTNMRLLFIKEEGFLKKSYTTTLNLPYKEIKTIVRRGMYLEFTDTKDKMYRFESDVSTPIVENALKELMKTPS